MPNLNFLAQLKLCKTYHQYWWLGGFWCFLRADRKEFFMMPPNFSLVWYNILKKSVKILFFPLGQHFQHPISDWKKLFKMNDWLQCFQKSVKIANIFLNYFHYIFQHKKQISLWTNFIWHSKKSCLDSRPFHELF